MRRGFGFLWLALTLVFMGVVGVVSYQAGVATHLPEGVAVPPQYYEPHFYGFGLIGLLFFVFLLFLLFRFMAFGLWAGRGWGHGGRGWKHGSFSGGVPPAIDERMQEWHKRAHGEATTAPPSDTR